MTKLLVSSLESSKLLSEILSTLKTNPTWQNLTLPDADVTVINQEGSGIKIAEVRQLISDASFKPYTRQEKLVLLLNLEQASLPAQQALLKYLEEPPPYLRIIVTTNNLQAVLPTIQSRCTIEHLHQSTATTIPQEVAEWITKLPQASYADIIDLSATYKDRSEALLFLKQCLFALKKPTTFPTEFAVTTSQHILTSINHLQANANVRLTIEDCFFNIKNRF
jgi:hypothetical protein